MHLVKKLLTVSVLLSASVQAHNILEFPQPENNPEAFYAVTEIPAGDIIKYETDAKTGFIVTDHFQSMPVAYPTNYGSLTQSLAGNGDPLDVIFYTRAPLAPGTLIKLRPIGVLKMIDGGETDDKIVAVPDSKIDPTYDDIKNITDLPKSRLCTMRFRKQQRLWLTPFTGAAVKKTGALRRLFAGVLQPLLKAGNLLAPLRLKLRFLVLRFARQIFCQLGFKLN